MVKLLKVELYDLGVLTSAFLHPILLLILY